MWFQDTGFLTAGTIRRIKLKQCQNIDMKWVEVKKMLEAANNKDSYTFFDEKGKNLDSNEFTIKPEGDDRIDKFKTRVLQRWQIAFFFISALLLSATLIWNVISFDRSRKSKDPNTAATESKNFEPAR